MSFIWMITIYHHILFYLNIYIGYKRLSKQFAKHI